MSSAYNALLEATIQHLEELQRHGTRFVEVAPETLAKLKRALPPPARVAPRSIPAGALPGAPPLPIPLLHPMEERVPEGRERRRSGAVQGPEAAEGRAFTGAATGVPVATAVPPPPALDPATKAAALQELRERAMVCMKCPNLAGSRTNVVFGVGDIDAQLMFVGEAPGADEDAQGEPFVGAAGQLLTRILQTMGFTRGQVYIANILKCRPDTPGEASGNRKPTPEEMKTCIPYLHSQIDLIQPRVLVALGGVAVEGLLGKSGITKLRGQWQTYRGIPLMPTFHPSYLLRTNSPRDKRHVWEDMLAVLEKLGLPISEKQRGFFLPRSQ